MILVDTSVLIDYFRGAENAPVAAFERIVREALPFGITEHVYAEVLQGAATEGDYRRLKQYLDTQTFYSLRHGRDSFARAARLYFDCRRAGFTLSGTLDCLIAETAIENRVLLLHNDRDYATIARVAPGLRLYET